MCVGRGEEDEDDTEEWTGEGSCHGQWYLIEEKLPIYTVVIRYLACPPQPLYRPPSLDTANESSFTEPSPFATDDQNPKPVNGLIIEKANEWGVSMSERVRGGCLISASPQIIEDMVLNIAELVALEYLDHLCNGKQLTSMNPSRTLKLQWEVL